MEPNVVKLSFWKREIMKENFSLKGLQVKWAPLIHFHHVFVNHFRTRLSCLVQFDSKGGTKISYHTNCWGSSYFEPKTCTRLYLHVTLLHVSQSHFRSKRQSASDTVDLQIRFSFCISFLRLWKQTGVRECETCWVCEMCGVCENMNAWNV